MKIGYLERIWVVTITLMMMLTSFAYEAFGELDMHPSSDMVSSVMSPRTIGNSYYISPTGSDSNSGTSESSPWLTFAYAIPKLKPGDTLILLDGVYELNTTGYPDIQHSYGLPGAPITMKAQHQWKAILRSDGKAWAFHTKDVTWWVFDGLYADANGSPGKSPGYAFAIEYTWNTVARNLLGTNAYKVGSLYSVFLLIHDKNFTLEDSEAYNFDSVGFNIYGSHNITARRLYANSRWNGSVGEGIILNGTPYSVIENSISEGNNGIGIEGFDTNTYGAGGRHSDVLGSISLNDRGYGLAQWSQSSIYDKAMNNTFKDSVAINTKKGKGVYGQEAWNATYDGVSVIGSVGPDDAFGHYEPVNTRISNSLVIDSASGYGFGFMGSDWFIEHSNSFNNKGGNYDRSETIDDNAGNIQRSMSKEATGMGMGKCLVYVPDVSSMRGAGKNGADIGANVLYRYENRTLTTQPLWDPVTGEFPHGPFVPGVNDIPGSSLFDVHERLNVNSANCPFPKSYGKQVARVDVTPTTTTINADQIQQFAAKAYDQNGNQMQVQFKWGASGGVIDSTGLYTPDKVGSNTVTASAGSKSGSASVVVTPGTLKSIGVQPKTATIMLAQKVKFTAEGLDAKGNGVSISPAWSSSGGSVDSTGTFTPNSVGKFTVTASQGGISGSAEVTVTPGDMVSLEVTPTAATTTADGQIQFSATGKDSLGNKQAVNPSWSASGGADAGSIDANGLLSPNKVGGYVITATLNSLKAEAQVKVIPGNLTDISISPQSAQLKVGESKTFTVLATDSKGNEITDANVEWSVTGGIGDVSASGEFKAKTKGNGTVSANVGYNGASKSVSASITVLEKPSNGQFPTLPTGSDSFALMLFVAIPTVAIIVALLAILMWSRRRKKKQNLYDWEHSYQY